MRAPHRRGLEREAGGSLPRMKGAVARIANNGPPPVVEVHHQGNPLRVVGTSAAPARAGQSANAWKLDPPRTPMSRVERTQELRVAGRSDAAAEMPPARGRRTSLRVRRRPRPRDSN